MLVFIVGEQFVEAKVKRLFDHLGGDQDAAATLACGGIFPERGEHIVLNADAVDEREASVKQAEPDRRIVVSKAGTDVVVGADGLTHGIAHPGDAMSRACQCQDAFSRASDIGVVGDFVAPH